MADFIDQPIAYPSADEVNAAKYNRLARAVGTRQTVPADKPFAIVGLLTVAVGNNTQRRNTETAIDNLTGVDQAKILVYGTTPPAAEVPAGYHVEAIVEVRFRVEPDAE